MLRKGVGAKRALNVSPSVASERWPLGTLWVVLASEVGSWFGADLL